MTLRYDEYRIWFTSKAGRFYHYSPGTVAPGAQITAAGNRHKVTAEQVLSTKVIPATSSILSLLALKLVAMRRISYVHELAADPAAGLFAGLGAIAKATSLTDYSYRTDPKPVATPRWADTFASACYPCRLPTPHGGRTPCGRKNVAPSAVLTPGILPGGLEVGSRSAASALCRDPVRATPTARQWFTSTRR
jgi:hypothetical protein